jgi:Na+/melibiose symporter-like transporter
MNLKVVLISFAVVFFIIGVDQSLRYGVQFSYWAFMLSGFAFLWFQYLKKKEEEKGKDTPQTESGKQGKSKKNMSVKGKKRT